MFDIISSKDFYDTMNSMEFDEFLSWLRQSTEAEWRVYEPVSFEAYQQRGVGGSDWRKNTGWIGGFSDTEIISFELEWHITFPPDYRRFLSQLGAPDKDTVGAHWVSDDKMVRTTKPSFYNWRVDKAHLEGAFDWPLEGLLFDVEQGLWGDSWGAWPGSMEDRRHAVSRLVAQAPPLIPICGHRYLLGHPIVAGNPVLSVYQSDIIIYATDFRRYLLLELSKLLNLNHELAYTNAVQNYDEDLISEIPFWGEIILGRYQQLDPEERNTD